MRRKWKDKILRITYEVFATPIDLVLFTLFMIEENSFSVDYSMRSLMERLDRLEREGKDRIIRDAIYRAKYKGWIKQNLQLTKEGRNRLQNFLPIVLPSRHWDGNWYLVSYDIPENMRGRRDVLRENLKKLGFGLLHSSCWISSVNYLSNIEELINFYHLQSFVILAQTNKLGREDSRSLANRVWKLDKINQLYIKLISQWEKASENERFWLTIKYINILKQDPQLPLEILPDDWRGREAYLKARKYLNLDNKT